jgi:hypothetical protein
MPHVKRGAATLWDCRAASQPWNFQCSWIPLACQDAFAHFTLRVTRTATVRLRRRFFFYLRCCICISLSSPAVAAARTKRIPARGPTEIFIVGEPTRFYRKVTARTRGMELLTSESPSFYSIYESTPFQFSSFASPPKHATLHHVSLHPSSRNNSP